MCLRNLFQIFLSGRISRQEQELNRLNKKPYLNTDQTQRANSLATSIGRNKEILSQSKQKSKNKKSK